MAFSGAQITRLGNYGAARQVYGSFAAKTETIVEVIEVGAGRPLYEPDWIPKRKRPKPKEEPRKRKPREKRPEVKVEIPVPGRVAVPALVPPSEIAVKPPIDENLLEEELVMLLLLANE